MSYRDHEKMCLSLCLCSSRCLSCLCLFVSVCCVSSAQVRPSLVVSCITQTRSRVVILCNVYLFLCYKHFLKCLHLSLLLFFPPFLVPLFPHFLLALCSSLPLYSISFPLLLSR